MSALIRYKVAAVILVSFLASRPMAWADAPWQKTAGPPGVRVNVIYKANNVIYAGTETQGVHRSTDGGVSWAPANHGIEHTMIRDLVFSGGNLLAAVSNGCPGVINVYKSTDNGATWSPTNGLAGIIANSFAIKGAFVYAACFNLFGSSIFRSSDNGNNWVEVPSPISDGNEIFVSDNAIIVAEDNFIWRSVDEGASWDVVEQFALSGVSAFARVGTKLFAADGTVILTSTDNGANWTSTVFQSPVNSFSASGGTIFLGSNNKVFKSTDSGANWVDVSAGLGKGDIQALLYDGTSVFAGTPADAAGIYRSTNGGTSWSTAAAGLPSGPVIRSMIAFQNYVFAGTQGDGIYRSSDHGDSWAKTDVTNVALGQQLILSMSAKDSALFAGTADGIYRSTNGGSTFQKQTNGFPSGDTVICYSLAVSSNNVVAAVTIVHSTTSATDTIYYSSDGGNTWQQAFVPVNPTFVSSVASDGSSIAYAGVSADRFSDTGLYKSTNGGVTWVSKTTSLQADIERLAANGSNVLAGTLFTASFSTDFGETWFGSSPPGGGVFTYTIKGSSIFAGNQEGMSLSTDSGATWTSINDGFPTCPAPDVESSCADATFLYAGTANDGVWRKALAPVVLNVVSRKIHGSAGTFNIDMPLTGTRGVEDRVGDGGAAGTHTIVFNYSVDPTGTVATVTGHNPSGGTGTVNSISYSGTEMIVQLTNVSDGQVLTLGTSGGPAGPVSVPIGFLVGDANGNGAVNASDVAQTKIAVGQTLTGTNFRADPNTSGSVNASDVAIVKAHVGNALP